MLVVHFDERVLEHDTGTALHETTASDWITAALPHTEGPLRVVAMRDVLARGPLSHLLEFRGGRPATLDELSSVHTMAYIEDVRLRASAGGGWVTGTTRISGNSWEPLLVAAGTSLEALDTVLSGTIPVAYALVRPPGHHAQSAQADGYCFFNHAALVAQHARDRGVARVLVIDWDVHHGNGTQDIFYERDDVLTISMHMNHGAWGPSHTQTGYRDEVGSGAGAGYNINVPLPLGAGDSAYLRAFDDVVRPAALRFQPELIVVASGQDASAFDPNGRHNVTMAGFHGLGLRCAELAQELSGGRIVGLQEGGYNPAYAAYCLLATLEGMLDVPPTSDPLAYVPEQNLGVEDVIRDAANQANLIPDRASQSPLTRKTT